MYAPSEPRAGTTRAATPVAGSTFPSGGSGTLGAADIAEAAIDTFYFKPAKAIFRALELETYRARAVRFEAPVLDLGCGDGSMAGLLRRGGRLAEAPARGLEIGG